MQEYSRRKFEEQVILSVIKRHGHNKSLVVISWILCVFYNRMIQSTQIALIENYSRAWLGKPSVCSQLFRETLQREVPLDNNWKQVSPMDFFYANSNIFTYFPNIVGDGWKTSSMCLPVRHAVLRIWLPCHYTSTPIWFAQACDLFRCTFNVKEWLNYKVVSS